MSSLYAIICSFIILIIFIIVIEFTKKRFENQYKKKTSSDDSYEDDDNPEDYRIQEFIPIFKSTSAYAVILTLFLNAFGSLIEFNIKNYLFKDLFTLDTLIIIIKGCAYITILNATLYLGHIIQLVKRIEYLSIEDKNFVLILKENLYGPLLEEFIYRGIIFNILKDASFTNLQCALISSIMFGICKAFIKLQKI
jgi:membrane protease YdiL (CAAX protease family)